MGIFNELNTMAAAQQPSPGVMRPHVAYSTTPRGPARPRPCGNMMQCITPPNNELCRAAAVAVAGAGAATRSIRKVMENISAPKDMAPDV